MKQNLRPATLNKFVVTFKNLETFHATRSENEFNLADITTEFISDWVYWLMNEWIKFDGHPNT